MTDLNTWRTKVDEAYGQFFSHLNVNPATGDVPTDSARKFACHPYIGSQYGCGATAKVLFVGLDIGVDENVGQGIQSFEMRRAAIEDRCLKCHNPHIAGTYFTAMRYAGPESLREQFPRFRDANETCKALLKKRSDLPGCNPLRYIALTNYYKWVKKGSCTRDFKPFLVDKDAERTLLRDEMQVLEPDLVIFQSRTFFTSHLHDVVDLMNEVQFAWYVVPHPSYPNARKQRPGYVSKPICENGKAL